MSDDTGHRTATIPRPRPSDDDPRHLARAARRASTPRRDEDGRLIRKRRTRVVLALLAAVIAGSLAASVLILPVKAWLNQREELSNRERELGELNVANDELAEDVGRLETERGIIEAAREELGLVRGDEKVFRVVMDPQLLGNLPEGWLFPTIGVLIANRSGQVAIMPTVGEPVADPPAEAATTPP